MADYDMTAYSEIDFNGEYPDFEWTDDRCRHCAGRGTAVVAPKLVMCEGCYNELHEHGTFIY